MLFDLMLLNFIVALSLLVWLLDIVVHNVVVAVVAVDVYNNNDDHVYDGCADDDVVIVF